MDPAVFTEFLQNFNVEFHRNSTAHRADGFLSNIRPLEEKDDGRCLTWIDMMERYFLFTNTPEVDRAKFALMTTKGKVGAYVQRLITNNAAITWLELKNLLLKYYHKETTSEDAMTELVNIKQGRNEGIEEYFQRVLKLGERAYVGGNVGDPVRTRQLKHYYTKGLKDKEIRLTVRKEEPRTLREAYEKSLNEEKWRAQDDSEDDRAVEPMEVNHMRGRPNQNGPPTRERERVPERRGNWNRYDNHRPPMGNRDATYRRYVPSCWSCGRKGHIQRFCPGNGAPPFTRRPVDGRRQ